MPQYAKIGVNPLPWLMMTEYAERKGPEGMERYQLKENRKSIDGFLVLSRALSQSCNYGVLFHSSRPRFRRRPRFSVGFMILNELAMLLIRR